MRNALAPPVPAVSSTQGLLAKPAAISPLSRVSAAVSGTSVFVPPAAVGATVRGAATVAHPAGMVGSGGRHVLSARLDGSQEPMTLPPPPDELLDVPPLP